MKVDFRPLRKDAVFMLSDATGIDFTQVEFSSEKDWFCCTVRDDDGTIALIVVFEFKSSSDAHVSTVLIDKRALTRRLLTTIIGTVFKRAARITAHVDPGNEIAWRQMYRMGFKQEGYLRRGLDGVRDAVVFGLLPEDCPYLVGRPFRFVQVHPTHPTHQGVN